MTDLNALSPTARSAAMRGGTAGWGQVGGLAEHIRYMELRPKRPGRKPKCNCGCGTPKTHTGFANGVCLTSGCEMYVRRWTKSRYEYIRTPPAKPVTPPPSKSAAIAARTSAPVSIIDDVMTDKITLHGLGFVQVQLEGGQRLHVWHPELPRRACFKYSAIHDHRFNFTSRVIVGKQINHCFELERNDEGGFVLYLHEGARTPGGGRPWTPDGRAHLIPDGTITVEAGNDYNTRAYHYHRTEPGGDGRVATIMAKRGEYPAGAHSTCVYGIQPDTDFDRYQWSPAQLWEIVADVMLGQRVTP